MSARLIKNLVGASQQLLKEPFAFSAYELTFDNLDLVVWYCLLDEINIGKHASKYPSILSEQELARAEKFHFSKDRDLFVTSRILLRSALSRYMPLQPGQWQFDANEYGKPEIASEHMTPIKFNLSHTDKIVVCAISKSHEVGIDIESISREFVNSDAIEKYLSENEKNQLQGMSVKDKQFALYQFWTLKESYIKARGMGFSLPINAVEFDITNNNNPQVNLNLPIKDDPNRWRFQQFMIAEHYLCSVAINLYIEDK